MLILPFSLSYSTLQISKKKVLATVIVWKVFVSLRIQSECGEIRTRKAPNKDTFHVVWYFLFIFHIYVISIKNTDVYL